MVWRPLDNRPAGEDGVNDDKRGDIGTRASQKTGARDAPTSSLSDRGRRVAIDSCGEPAEGRQLRFAFNDGQAVPALRCPNFKTQAAGAGCMSIRLHESTGIHLQ